MTASFVAHAPVPNLLPPSKVVVLEIDTQLRDRHNLDGYKSVYCLIRWKGVPLGHMVLPVKNGICPLSECRTLLVNTFRGRLSREVARRTLLKIGSQSPENAETSTESAPTEEEITLVSIAICTRDRPALLRRCLASVLALTYPLFEIIVVVNAPTDAAFPETLAKEYPTVKVVVERVGGLNRARNLAMTVARGDIVAFTDDDATVDRHWVSALVRAFKACPDALCVTGLIVPAQLNTSAQVLFERFGGFGRGYEPQWYRVESRGSATDVYHLGAGRFGAGANMAFRRRLTEIVGNFDPALDVGTPSEGGGDLEMFFRVLEHGCTLVYEPAAIVAHRHRPNMAELYQQLASWGVSLNAYLFRIGLRYGRLRPQLLWFYCRWVLFTQLSEIVKDAMRQGDLPRSWQARFLLRSFTGPVRYWRGHRRGCSFDQFRRMTPEVRSHRDLKPACVRHVNILAGMKDLADVAEYRETYLFIHAGSRVLGQAKIYNAGKNLHREELATIVVRRLPEACVNGSHLLERVMGTRGDDPEEFSSNAPALKSFAVSVVIPTVGGRSAMLERCLNAIVKQKTRHSVEIVVVDNNPESRETRDCVERFQHIRVVAESRKGLAYARNAGIVASKGEIIVTTDDDTVPCEHWIQDIVAPFQREDVGAVTGLTVPLEMETKSQQIFEEYGGLGRGLSPFEVNRDWLIRATLLPPRVWDLGATANAAFRRSVITSSDVGLMYEALGPGSPAGGGEDIYLLYQVLKAGHTVAYSPDAWVSHEHRRTPQELRRLLYAYSKGHTAYLLTTVFRDLDLRALTRIFWVIPIWQLAQMLGVYRRLPKRLVIYEVLGHCAAPFALIWSRLRMHTYGCVMSRARVSPVRSENVPATDLEFEAD